MKPYEIHIVVFTASRISSTSRGFALMYIRYLK